MADEFIRQLPHDEQGLDKQWSEIFDKFSQLFNSNEGEDADVEIFKVKALDALVDYILAEPDPTVTQPYVKIALIENVMKHCAEDPMPSLPELVRLVQRILDREDVFNQWFLSSIEAFHFKFRLCENLITAQSFELVKSFLESLQRHTFLNDQVDKTTEANWQQYLSRRIFSPLTCDSNKLNDETAMVAIRPTFQQIFR